MNKLVPALVLLMAALSWAADPNPADYPLTVHVSSSRLIPPGVLRLKVTLDGKKLELQGNPGPGILAPGDYKAKRTEDSQKSYDLRQTYEFLLLDHKTRKYWLVGISE